MSAADVGDAADAAAAGEDVTGKQDCGRINSEDLLATSEISGRTRAMTVTNTDSLYYLAQMDLA